MSHDTRPWLTPKRRISPKTMLAGAALAMICVASRHETSVWAGNQTRFSGPLSSQPLAISADDEVLAVANPDNNTVSFFSIKNGRDRKFDEVQVGIEPNGVALTPDGKKAFSANTVSGTVSVMKVSGVGNVHAPHRHIQVGTEPYSLVMSPNGTRLYVANARSNTVSVIDPDSEQVIATIRNVGSEPRGMALTNDGDGDDLDETLYVTQFLSLPIAGKIDGADDAKAGHVTVISTASNAVTGDVILNPIADTGFKAAGDALARIPPGAAFTFRTGAYANQLNNIAIYGNYAFVPNTGSSPNGPVRFDVNTQSLLHVIDRNSRTDANKTINMHRAVGDQTNPAKLFVTQPWAIAFRHHRGQAYVASAASNILVKLEVDATGNARVLSDPLDSSRVLQIPTGKNPRGVVITSDDSRAYVMNYVSRDVTVVDLTLNREQVVGTLASAALPAPGSLADRIQIGKELYFTSVGVFDPPVSGGAPIRGRMSNNGWGACSACHPFALSDNVVWIFPPGPRRTLPQHTDFDQTDPQRRIIRALNWSAERDEEEDFELNIRVVSGGQGLIVLGDGITPDPNVANFTPLASGGRNQLKVRGVGAWDALRTFVQFGVRGPISPVSKTEPDVVAGRALFGAANCQQCHGGAQWTSSRVRFTPPPGAGLVVNGQLINELRKVGTFDSAFFNEVRQNAAAPLGADGFAPPSLLSVFAFPFTLLHNGVAPSLEAVLANVTHRSAGTSGVDTLSNAADRAKVARFLLSIDSATVPFPQP